MCKKEYKQIRGLVYPIITDTTIKYGIVGGFGTFYNSFEEALEKAKTINFPYNDEEERLDKLLKDIL